MRVTFPATQCPPFGTWIGGIFNALNLGHCNVVNKYTSTAAPYSLEVKCMNNHIQISSAGIMTNVPFQENVTFSEHISSMKNLIATCYTSFSWHIYNVSLSSRLAVVFAQIHWSQEWRSFGSSADNRCSSYIWVNNNCICLGTWDLY